MTQRIERVLDKLYNLKGENNFVIAEIEENIRKAEATINNATEEENTNEIKKSDVIGKLTVFNNQKDAFLSAFSDLDDDTFSSLRDINVEANFGTMVSEVLEKSPEYCEKLDKEIKEYESLIEKAKETVAEQTALVANYETNKREEQDKRNKLVSLMEQSLSTEEVEREALSTSYVKKILSAFELFTDEEITALAKLIMFPEDGLVEYNDAYDETVAARFSVHTKEETDNSENEIEEIENTDDTSLLEKETIEENEEIINPIIEENPEEKENTSKNQAEEMYQNVASSEEVTDIIEKYQDGDTTELSLTALNMNEESEEPETSTSQEIIKEPEDSEIDKIIESLGLNPNNVNDELKEILSQADYKIIEENYELLRSAYVDEEAIYKVINNHNYLVDEDLNKKITLLRAKGIAEAKIKEFIEKENSVLRNKIDEFSQIIETVETKDGKITNENIYKIDLDNKTYDKNKKALNDAGYDIEEKEERNYNAVIYSSPYLPDDIKILKDYLISIIKRNSKYALSVFWKQPAELVIDIDDIIEAGLENILETNPEVLEENNRELIKRVKYCHDSGHQVYVGEDKDLYCDYITSYARFQEKIGNIKDLPELEDNNNTRISDLIGKPGLAEMLEKYYEAPAEYKISEDIITDANSIRQSILNALDYEDAGKYTYKVKDILVSKNKVDRNIKVILTELEKNGQSFNGLEKEIVLTAILYNLRISEKEMESLVNEYLNQGGNE